MAEEPQTGDFLAATRWAPTAEGAEGEVHASWAQGRAAFGGLVAGIAARTMAEKLPADRTLRSALVSFVGPVAPGPAAVTVEVLRAGGSVTHAQARVVQGGATAAVVLGAFGTTRDTHLATPGPTPPTVPAPEALPVFPFMPGITPTFTQHYDYRWTTKTLPFSGAEVGHVQGWIRARGGQPVFAADLLGLLDAWPPPIWSRARKPIPGSTLTWQANIVSPPPPEGFDGAAWWLYDARSIWAEGGYTDFEARLWDAQGRLVACSRQAFAEFSAR